MTDNLQSNQVGRNVTLQRYPESLLHRLWLQMTSPKPDGSNLVIYLSFFSISSGRRWRMLCPCLDPVGGAWTLWAEVKGKIKRQKMWVWQVEADELKPGCWMWWSWRCNVGWGVDGCALTWWLTGAQITHDGRICLGHGVKVSVVVCLYDAGWWAKWSSIADVGLFGALEEGWTSDEWEDGGRDAVGGKTRGCRRSTHHNPGGFLTERWALGVVPNNVNSNCEEQHMKPEQ